MKSHKDTQLFIGLLLIGLSAGLVGRFFETAHFSFPAANDLNQAAAILATQENIVGSAALSFSDSVTLGIAETIAGESALSPAPDIAFSRESDCGSPLSIKAAGGRTVGFLCVNAKDPNAEAKVAAAVPEVNALIVSFDFGTDMPEPARSALADQALHQGAAMIVGRGPEASTEASTYEGKPIVFSLGAPATKKDARPKQVSVTATLESNNISHVVIR